jgi:hypothetical protein
MKICRCGKDLSGQGCCDRVSAGVCSQRERATETWFSRPRRRGSAVAARTAGASGPDVGRKRRDCAAQRVATARRRCMRSRSRRFSVPLRAAGSTGGSRVWMLASLPGTVSFDLVAAVRGGSSGPATGEGTALGGESASSAARALRPVARANGECGRIAVLHEIDRVRVLTSPLPPACETDETVGISSGESASMRDARGRRQNDGKAAKNIWQPLRFVKVYELIKIA